MGMGRVYHMIMAHIRSHGKGTLQVTLEWDDSGDMGKGRVK